MPVIGFSAAARRSPVRRHLVAAFRQGLKEDQAIVEGQNVTIEYRFGGQSTRPPSCSRDRIWSRRPVDSHRRESTLPAFAAKAATSTIPIVFASGGDPVSGGLVASLNRPGGNVTGVNLFLILARGRSGWNCCVELVPKAHAHRPAASIRSIPIPKRQRSGHAEAAAQALGLQILMSRRQQRARNRCRPSPHCVQRGRRRAVRRCRPHS